VLAQHLPDTIEWSVASTAGPAGAPVIAGQMVVVPLDTGAIAAHQMIDGAPRWSTPITATQSLAADDSRVYVASDEALHALRAADGSVAWRAVLGGAATAPPLAHAGWVVAAAAGDLIALRASDGVVLWRKHFGPIEFRPALDGDLLIASLVEGRVVAVNLQDGAERWRSELGASPGEPFTIAGRVYAGTKDKYFYSLFAASGRVEDHRRLGAEVRGRVAVNDRHVFFAAMDNMVRAVLRRGGELRWQQGLPYRPGAGPVVLGDVIVVPGYSDGPLPAFSLETGAAAGSVNFGRQLIALPVFTRLADGRNAVVGITGALDNKWVITLRAQSRVPLIAVQPLTVLPGVVVTLPQPPAR